jgi:hypothetical protein
MYGNQNTFDFVSQPVNMNIGIPQQQIMPNNQSRPIEQPVQVSSSGSCYKFPVIKEDNSETAKKMLVKIDNDIDLSSSTKKKGKSRKSENNESLYCPMGQVNTNEIVKGEVVEDLPTINTYFETAGMIKQSMDQIDTVIGDVKRELDDVRNSRTLKSKYNIIVGLAGNLSDLMNARISAIKELNNCISKSNDMDYKRQKDRKEAMSGAGSGDELAVMNLYRSIVQDPNIVLGQAGQKIPDYMVQQMQQQTPNVVSGIVRATDTPSAGMTAFDPTQDQGYINYMANMPASMNALLMEQNPDIKEVVVFDASTGAKWFQVMNMKTNQVIPNMQVTDQMFMEDTTLNIKNRTAQNINLGKTYPLVVINDNVSSQY